MAELRKCGCGKGRARAASIIADNTPTNKRCITTDKAPQPVGPYSQAVVIDNTVYVSGCLGLTLPDNKLIDGGAAAETKQALKNMGIILEAAGSSYNNVVKTTIYVENLDDFATVNQVYQQFFQKEFPARACVQVARLPLDAKVEIEAVATTVPPGGAPAPQAAAEGGPPVEAGGAAVPPGDAAVPQAAGGEELTAMAGETPAGEVPAAEEAPPAEEGAPAEAPAEGAPAEDAPPAEAAPPPA